MVRQLKRFLFPGAGRSAQPEIQAAIDRYRRMPLAFRAQNMLWAWLLGPDGTPPYKFTQAEVNYTDVSWRPDLNCGNCQRIYLHPPTSIYICSGIRGEIVPQGMCTIWEKPMSAARYRAYQLK